MSLSNLQGMQSGTLSLVGITTSKYFIPHLLKLFCGKLLNVDVQMKVGNRSLNVLSRERKISLLCKKQKADGWSFKNFNVVVSTKVTSKTVSPFLAILAYVPKHFLII